MRPAATANETYRRRWHLRNRLTFLVAFLTTVAILATATLLGVSSLRSATNQIQSEARLLTALAARTLSGETSPNGIQVPDARSQAVLALLNENERIQGVWIFDPDGASTRTDQTVPPTQDEIDLAAAALRTNAICSIFSWSVDAVVFRSPPTVHVAAPFTDASDGLNRAIVLRISTAHLNDAALTQFLITFILCAVLIGLSAVSAWMFVRRATAPLDGLAHVGEALIERNFRQSDEMKKELEVLINDPYVEISSLAKTFSDMLVRLDIYVASLKDASSRSKTIREELNAARSIQMGLLPQDFNLGISDRIDLYAAIEPAKAVGGDLYDFFQIDKRHIFIVIGDVSDKGVPAGLFMAMTKTLLANEVHQGTRDLQTVLERVNAALCLNNPQGMFVTLFTAILDLESGVVIYADGGHEPPIVLRKADGSARKIDKVGGEPLGVFPDATYKPGRIELNQGDAVVLYTDGVTEAMNQNREQYTPARLESTLTPLARSASAKQITEDVLESVHEHAGQQAQSDDIALLVIRWQGD